MRLLSIHLVSHEKLVHEASGSRFKNARLLLTLLAAFSFISPQPLGAEDLHLASQLEENAVIQSAAADDQTPVPELLQRDDSSPNKDRNLYFSFSGMGVWVENDSLSATDLSGDLSAGGGAGTGIGSLRSEINAGNLKLKERGGGYGATAAVGKKVGKGLRGEIEFAYRSGGFEDLILREIPASTQNGVDIDFVNAGYSTRSLLANLIWDIPLTKRLSPYVGAGLGLAWTTVSEGRVESGKNGFAWQLMGGLSYRATDRMELFGGYRYFATETEVRVLDHVLVDVDTHSVEAGIRFFLDAPEKSSTEGGSLFAFSDQAAKNPFYIGVSGGFVQQQDMGTRFDGITFNEGFNTQSNVFKAGYGLELALGYRFCSICRVELEYSYKLSEVDSVIDRAPGQFDNVTLNPNDDALAGGSSRSIIHALLINLYADLDIGNIKKKYGILPFAGVGLGAMYIDFKRNRYRGKKVGGGQNISSLRIAKARWAAQMTAGVGYSLTEQVTLGIQYKYLAMLGSDDVFGESDKSIAADADADNSYANNIGIHSAGLFARYNF